MGVPINLTGETFALTVMFWSVRPLTGVFADSFDDHKGGNGSV